MSDLAREDRRPAMKIGWMKKILFIGIINLFVLACLEVGLRVYGIDPAMDRLKVYQFDDELGWKTRTGFKYFRSTPQYSHFNYYNLDGISSAKGDLNASMSTDTQSIALIGDSFAEGYYLPFEQSPAHLVQEKVGPRWQVINLGVSGYAPDQYLLTVRRHFPRYDVHSAVVFFFPFNDIKDSARASYNGYSKPLFDDALETVVNLPLERGEGKVLDDNALQFVLHNSAIYSLLRPIVKSLNDYELDRSRAPKYEREGMKRALRLIQKIELEFPIERFLVYYIPDWTEFELGSVDENAALFREVCRELNLDAASLADLPEAAAEFADYYIPIDRHFSPQGAAVVADQIHRLLSKP